jgi:geranylgeranyl diphosphate synthase, type II
LNPEQPANFNLKDYLNSQADRINPALDGFIRRSDETDRLVEAMRYSLMAGGKRIRPILCLASAEAVGGDSAEAIPVACALEMIHTYSLIHDDLPAMDNDDLRRGKPTCHIAFDEATAILCGDALLTLAFQILSESPPIDAASALKRLEIVHILAGAAGYRGMIQGQMLDIASEGTRLTLSELTALHGLKTGAMIEASVRCGAIIGGASNSQADQLSRYAQHIGLAFQVSDDILNIEGDPSIVGKSVGTDQLRQKNTFPALLGLEESKEFANQLVRQSLEAIEIFDERSNPLRGIARYIVERKR